MHDDDVNSELDGRGPEMIRKKKRANHPKRSQNQTKSKAETKRKKRKDPSSKHALGGYQNRSHLVLKGHSISYTSQIRRPRGGGGGTIFAWYSIIA